MNCGKVGLFKHERLGCCSDECRYWYVTNLLGYDREFLLTPAWDKVVYHIRLPSGNAEISSLQLDELEFDRAHETILVVAAPAWIARQKVLAELPYSRFDNVAWQHLRADGTLSLDELERFRRMCYDDPLLYHKLGEHVFQKIRGHGGTSPITPSTTTQLAPGGVPLMPALPPQLTGTLQIQQIQAAPPPALSAPEPLRLAQLNQSSLALPAPEDFVQQVRDLFARRGYQVDMANADSVNTLLLFKSGKRALATCYWHEGMVGSEPMQAFVDAMLVAEAGHGYFVTNGHFTLQAEDVVAGRAVQLIDGQELAALLSNTRTTSTPPVATHTVHTTTENSNGNGTGQGPATVSLRGATAMLDGALVHEAASNGSAAKHEEAGALHEEAASLEEPIEHEKSVQTRQEQPVGVASEEAPREEASPA